MLALIMAGGKGTRLQMGEKGLVRLCDRPLIEYVLTALEKAGFDILVVTTPRTPYTANYCRIRGVDQVCTEGTGYVEDIIEAVHLSDEHGPVLIVCADIPGITPHHLEEIVEQYYCSGKAAASVWIPVHLVEGLGCTVQHSSIIGGIPAVPAGLNILNGCQIDEEQEETEILLCDPALAFNINTPGELRTAESFFYDTFVKSSKE